MGVESDAFYFEIHSLQNKSSFRNKVNGETRLSQALDCVYTLHRPTTCVAQLRFRVLIVQITICRMIQSSLPTASLEYG